MVRHQMPFENLAFLFAAPAHGKSVPDVGVSDRRWLSAAVWARIQHGTCSPIWNGIGSGKALSFILLIVGHQATRSSDTVPANWRTASRWERRSGRLRPRQ